MGRKQSKTVILLVDDDSGDRLLAERALVDVFANECEVFAVNDGTDAWEYLKHWNGYRDHAVSPRPDLMLLDLSLPKMHGLEVLKNMKQDPSLEDIPVVTMSNSAKEFDVMTCYALGAAMYKAKPMDHKDLVAQMMTLPMLLDDI